MSNMKCSTIAIVGKPNAGKSTLMNQIMGQKISIVTPKAQTTRFNTRGVYNENDCQLIFTDTPGIFQPRSGHKLEEFIVNNAFKAVKKVDEVMMLIDATDNSDIESYKEIFEKLKNVRLKKVTAKKPIENISNTDESSTVDNRLNDLANFIIVLNKADVADQSIDLWHKMALDLELPCIAISAKKGTGISELLSLLQSRAKNGPWLFSADEYTSITERELAEEITREELYLELRHELPYSLKVETDTWEELEGGEVRIYHSIIVLKDSQKNIIIGEKGSMIKNIGIRARKQLTMLLDRNVHLFLHVKVRGDWIDKMPAIK